MRSPSGNPSAQATPALEVAMAGKPASSITRALITSQALGRTSIRGPACRARKSWAFCNCVGAFIDISLSASRMSLRAMAAGR